MTFQGTRVLITGGSAGIGRQLALDFTKRGASVIICGRDENRLNTLVAEAPNVRAFKCDVRDNASVTAFRDDVLRTFGPPDVLINNAAIFRRFDVQDSSLDVTQWLDEIDINVMGVLRMTYALLPSLVALEQATIVNVTSPSAYSPLAAAPVYSASKAALHSWTVSLRHQLRNTSVSVIELNPPVVDTQMNANNPDVEGLKRWSTVEFSEHVLNAFTRTRTKDILVGDAKLVKRMTRLAPAWVFSKMNPART